MGRRGFLRVSAASAATVAVVVATGCTTDPPAPVVVDPYALALPADGPGLLYYGYLLAIAQATFYQKVADTPPADFTAADRAVFTDLRDHEVVYRELFKYIIDPTAQQQLLPTGLVFNLTPFSLSTRAGVLAAAQLLEDLAAAAYPALLPLFSVAANKAGVTAERRAALLAQQALLLKTASVHARHAATVRDLLAPGSFANDDVVTSTGVLAGQAITKTPTEVMAALAPYFAPYVISVSI